MKTFIVDSFTAAAFKGNPAGVCLVTRPLSENEMLDVAQELNLSETTFVTATDDVDRVTIRFLSPKMEIPLCGHATLATAKVLFEENDVTVIRLRNIRHLDLVARRLDDQIELKFPSHGTVTRRARRIGARSSSQYCLQR
jgi:PhzF family phenazine biosynthesis protein